MVKGISRRVIVIKTPDPRLFEEAIFIVSGDVGPGVTQKDLLREAQQVAASYVRANRGDKPSRRLPAAFFVALGAAIVGFLWLATLIL